MPSSAVAKSAGQGGHSTGGRQRSACTCGISSGGMDAGTMSRTDQPHRKRIRGRRCPRGHRDREYGRERAISNRSALAVPVAKDPSRRNTDPARLHHARCGRAERTNGPPAAWRSTRSGIHQDGGRPDLTPERWPPRIGWRARLPDPRPVCGCVRGGRVRSGQPSSRAARPWGKARSRSDRGAPIVGR